MPWGAGGGTDATGRIVASILEKELGQPINVVNRTGGSGVVGHSAIAEAAPDGYTLGVATVEIGMMHWQGLTDLTWESYTPLALVNEDPAAVSVRADAPWADLKALIEDIKANPGQLQSLRHRSGWHLASGNRRAAVGAWDRSRGGSVGAERGRGARPAGPRRRRRRHRACLAARGAFAAGGGSGEGTRGDVGERNAAFPDVPTTQEAVGASWNIGAWRGIVGPKGLPDEVTTRLIPALEKVYNSAEYKEFMSGRGFGMRWAPGEEFANFMKESSGNLGSVMKKVGIAK